MAIGLFVLYIATVGKVTKVSLRPWGKQSKRGFNDYGI